MMKSLSLWLADAFIYIMIHKKFLCDKIKYIYKYFII